ncbi:Pancreatic alpha-amylase 2a5 [Halocaridina rubra]|uniref:Alpha-amylase n=1 Tax=Halocaridina rubra TaxID=373956 RepID=A0AAN8XHF2_HALRR
MAWLLARSSDRDMLPLAITLLAIVAPSLGQWDPNVSNGQVIVHLFEWPWGDIARECEDFLGPKGFGGVQVSPVNENVVVHQGNVNRPWWERYQPVSYMLTTRSGDEAAFQDMVTRCNNVGVRIYVDAVINHMSGGWPQGTVGTGGSSFDSGSQSYPGVPFSGFDFNDANCNTASGNIENYGDANQVRNCKLVGLNDLNQGSDYVRGKIIEFMNRLIGFGVAGFRVDASKHMWPGDMQAIFDSLDNLRNDVFGANARAFIFQEVIDLGGEAISAEEYVGNGRVTEFRYGKFLGEAFRGNNQLKWLSDFGEGWGMTDRANALVFIDNHDNQRGHGAGGDMILTFRVDRLYKMGTAYMLAWPYGFTRIMSSYYWDQNIVDGQDQNDWIGPPMDGNENIIGATINADGTCGGGWICEHRWRQITNMVEFRNVAHGTDMNDWWDNGSNQIAFCRGNKGFIAINGDGSDLTQTLQTCLSAGTYCDVISGGLENGSCTGKSVTVNADGTAYIELLTSEMDGVLAIHANSKQ